MISSAVKRAASLVKTTLVGSFKAMKSVGSKAVETVKAKFSKLTSVIHGSSKPLSRLTNSLKRAAKSVFLMAGAYAIFRGLKSLVSNAVSGNEEFAKSLNEIKANLTIAFHTDNEHSNAVSQYAYDGRSDGDKNCGGVYL